MKAIFSSKSYWIISILATAVIFAAMLNFGKTYKSEIDILISPKTPVTENNINLIMENARQISGTLTFYNDILKNNPDIKDPAAAKTSSERKNYWNSAISTKSISGSGVVRLSILNDSRSEAEKLSRAASLTLAQELSKYYNIKTEIDVKIIDGPITGQSRKFNSGILLAFSFLIALLSVYFSYAISDKLQAGRAGKKLLKLQKKQKVSSNKLSPEKAEEKLNKLLEGRI